MQNSILQIDVLSVEGLACLQIIFNTRMALLLCGEIFRASRLRLLQSLPKRLHPAAVILSLENADHESDSIETPEVIA